MDAARPFAAPCGPAGRIRRGARRALTVGVLVPAVALSLAGPALADVTAVTGNADGVRVTASGPLTLNVGPIPTVTLPVGGGNETDSLATVSAPGLLSAGIVNVSTIGSTGPSGVVNSFAEVADADLGISVAGLLGLDDLLTATTIRSDCQSNESGSTGSTTIADLTVLGNDITIDGTVDQQVPITLPVVGNVGTVHINEQIVTGTPPSTSIVVNAVRIELDVPVLLTTLSVDVILAQSECGVTGDGVAVPAGAIGGVLLAGLAAIGFVGYQLRHRRPGSSRA